MTRNDKVIIVDQDENRRVDLQKMVALAGLAVLGEAGYGIEAVSLAKETQPDAVLVSLEEPIPRAIQTVEALSDLLPQAPIVVYSTKKEPETIRKAMLAGAKDYLSVPLKDEEVMQSLHAVLSHEERRRQRLAGEAEEPVACGTVITVFGAKGGIGKTTISTNLAAALVQKTNASVVLVDMDTRFGDVAVLMDIPAERSISDLALAEEEQITKEMLQDCLYTHNTGVTILPAPIRPADWRHIHAGHIERVVNLLAQTYDYVILDTPGTFNDIVARCLEQATILLLVSTVDLASLKDTLLALDMLRSWNYPQEKLKLVVNSTNDASNIQPSEVKGMVGRDVFKFIPYDRTVSTATQLGMPLVISDPTSKAAECICQMADALSGTQSTTSSPENKSAPAKGILARILSKSKEESRVKAE
jgi:pilus assembly protein CpaE